MLQSFQGLRPREMYSPSPKGFVLVSHTKYTTTYLNSQTFLTCTCPPPRLYVSCLRRLVNIIFIQLFTRGKAQLCWNQLHNFWFLAYSETLTTQKYHGPSSAY